ncbi:MAG TPA: hypothetical protein VF629_07830 [Hymenobacter sp.]|jgi:hypothetical protein|uniref:hypothetical protein n=1 Tax=Hymenobacter sp. TaxID=1898978 RepID=UPI002EDB3397
MPFRRYLFRIACLALLSAPFAGKAQSAKAQYSGPYSFSGGGLDVRVERAVEYAAPGGRTLSFIQYHYTAKNRRRVYIDGFGMAPADTTFRYLTGDRTVSFRDSAAGPVRAAVPVKPTHKMMGDGTVNIPVKQDFPSYYREELLPGNYVLHVADVLNKQFPLGYERSERNGQQEIVTTYKTIPGAGGNKVKVAVQLVLPIAGVNKAKAFRLYFVAQEKPSHDDWGPVFTDAAKEAVQRYVNTFAARIKKT